MRWLHPYDGTRLDEEGMLLPTHRLVYPLLLERLASDGEWEPVDRLDATPENTGSTSMISWWRAHENEIAWRNGLDRKHMACPPGRMLCC
ncbi:hypothetical protein JS534_08175 [Bifidobacterium felsineum]|nr:hypothetical protein [Bifidobacterium felsineum]